jgi:hypothetical protein
MFHNEHVVGSGAVVNMAEANTRTRRADCIYCGADTGSREHTFPAALGGRRMNKGILCGPCNAKFSPLDALLSGQLNFLNGVIGVRPDRADEPRPAQVESVEGPLTLDHGGKPAFAAPRVLGDEPLADGRRKVSMGFANDQQVQEWLAKQKAAGLQVEQGRREEGQRFLADAIPVAWSFGGSEAFREIGRIALNFLAHRWPDAARSTALKQFKEWVEGVHVLADGAPRFVWYAPADAFALPDAAFAFGHQVALSLDEAGAYGRIRFFSTFDLFVWFGPLPGVSSETVLFEIDPLAEHPPNDLREATIERSVMPAALCPPTSDTLDLESLLGERLRSLLARVEDHQWAISTRGLLEALNATRPLGRDDRADHVTELLEPHLGRVVFLARHVSEQLRQRAHDEVTRVLADAMEFLLAPDKKSADGLSAIARTSLHLAFANLVDVVVTELDMGPLTDARLRLLLSGGPGAHAVGSVLTKQITGALGVS